MHREETSNHAGGSCMPSWRLLNCWSRVLKWRRILARAMHGYGVDFILPRLQFPVILYLVLHQRWLVSNRRTQFGREVGND